MSEPVLRLDGLTKRFGGLTAVDRVSLSFAPGTLHAVIGPNGAGKTTLFNLISGLLPADGGRIFFRGRDITGLKPHEVSRLGIKRTLQVKSVFPRLSVAENLWITAQAKQRFLNPLRSAGRYRETREKVERTLDQIGLAALASRAAGTLSYGDVALLEIGMAIISDPELLLLDEPFAALGPALRREMLDLVRTLQQSQNLTVLLVSHQPEDALYAAPRTAFVHDGHILQVAETRNLFDGAAVPELRAYLGETWVNGRRPV